MGSSDSIHNRSLNGARFIAAIPLSNQYFSLLITNFRLEKEKATLAAEVSDLQSTLDNAIKNQVKSTRYLFEAFLISQPLRIHQFGPSMI